MRIVFVHPDYHSGGAEIAGNWPPAWVAYLAGALKAKGFDDIHFIDAMTMHVSDEDLRARLVELQPDIVGVTLISRKHKERQEAVRTQMKDRAKDRAVPDLTPMACGGSRQQMQEPAE